MENPSQVEILQRLRTAEGHLRAVIGMVEAGRPCEEVLHQLNALQAALRAATIKVILCQVQSSFQAVVLENASPEKRIAEVKRLQLLYTHFAHYSNHPNEVINE